MSTLVGNLLHIKSHILHTIQQYKPLSSAVVRLVAVSKTKPKEDILSLYEVSLSLIIFRNVISNVINRMVIEIMVRTMSKN